jgi:hypothetical protein
MLGARWWWSWGSLAACAQSVSRLPQDPSPHPTEAPNVEDVTVAIQTAEPPTAPAHRDVVRPTDVVEAQPYRTETSLDIEAAGRTGTATLVDLAPQIGVWFVLELAWDDGPRSTWHLEDPAGTALGVTLTAEGLALTGDGRTRTCDVWHGALEAARSSGRAYGSLCDGALFLRNPTTGRKSKLEWTTDFLRDHVWGGEAITSFVKQEVASDPARVTSELGDRIVPPAVRGAPREASLDPNLAGRSLRRGDLGLPVDGAQKQLVAGVWYPLHSLMGAWVSILEPRVIDPAIRERAAPLLHPLDALEDSALVYMVAFDLAEFDIGYELGTDHPRLGWSERAPDAVVDPSIAGPDGFGDAAPLVRTGLLDPAYQARTVATFVGGFKRAHGAFHRGPFSTQNAASHYGFVENGTVLSRLQPGLATLVVNDDGTVDLRTWSASDDRELWRVRHARQNGVPLVERDEVDGELRPGRLVRNWAWGNWSGSVDGKLRTVRSGVCLQESEAGRFLLYSYFSSATPSAMALVDLAYGCTYGMLLDMNALEQASSDSSCSGWTCSTRRSGARCTRASSASPTTATSSTSCGRRRRRIFSRRAPHGRGAPRRRGWHLRR